MPDSALAVALNVTAVDAQAPGYLTIFPDGGPQPGTSSVNFPPGAPSPNAVVAKVGTDGRIRVFASAGVNVIVDVFGWFGPGGNASALHRRTGPRPRHPHERRAGRRRTDHRCPDRRHRAGAGWGHRRRAQRHRHRRRRAGLPDGVPVGSRPPARIERELRGGSGPSEHGDRADRRRREDQGVRVRADARHRRRDGLVRRRRSIRVRRDPVQPRARQPPARRRRRRSWPPAARSTCRSSARSSRRTPAPSS